MVAVLLAPCVGQVIITLSVLVAIMSSVTVRSFTAFLHSKSHHNIHRWRPRSHLSWSLRAISSKAQDLLRGKFHIPVSDAVQVHGEQGVVFVDGTWWLPALQRPLTGRQEYETLPRIAGAHFLDIDDLAATGPDLNPQNLPHMMPPPALWHAYLQACGILSGSSSGGPTEPDHVIIYGQAQCPFLHRAWFEFYSMGHELDHLHMLGGSLEDWKAAGGPVDDTPAVAPRAADLVIETQGASSFTTARQVVTKEQVRATVEALAVTVPSSATTAAAPSLFLLDARPPDRFQGQAPEPRAGLLKGHMPGARNIFSKSLLQPDNLNVLKSPDELESIFTAAGLPPPITAATTTTGASPRIVATCGSGVTACTILAALVATGRDPAQLYLYDGSWSEWGADPDVPVVVSE